MKFLQSPLIASVLGALLYLGITFWQLLSVRVHRPAVVSAAAKKPLTKAEAAHIARMQWDPQNPEVDDLIKELKAGKETLIKREEDLKEYAARLQTEREEIDRVAQGVQRMQTDFEKSLLKVKDDETGNLKRLSKMYSTMSPDGAAKIFKELDEESIGKILVLMKETDSALILDALAKQGGPAAKQAASLSERLRIASRSPLAKTK